MGTFTEKVLMQFQAVTSGFKKNVDSARVSINKQTASLKRSANAYKGGIRKLKAFRMEMLGVMFFGMMLQRTMFGLVAPAMEAFGVFDLFRDMLTVLFIPVMELLMPLFLGMFDFFTGLPEPVQKAMGIFVIFVGVLGTLLMTVGQMSLGWTAFKKAFPSITGWIKALANGFKFLTKLTWGARIAVGATIGLLIATIVGLVLAWKENFNRIHDWFQVFVEGLKMMFGGLINLIKGLVSIIIGVFTLNPQKIWSGIKLLFNGMKDIISGQFQAVLGLAVTLGTGLLRAFKAPLEWIADKFKSVFGGVKDKISGAIGTVADFFGFGGGKSTGTSGGSFNDFIWRPGQKPISINPNDTLVGTKSGGGTGGGSVVVSPVFNVTVQDKNELTRLFDDFQRRLVDDVKRLVRS